MRPGVAVIGGGYWGKNLARNFAALGALRGVVDRDPATAAAQAGINGVQALTFEDALSAPEITAFAIATPAETHAELAVRALLAGKHVFVEKPVALTEADAMRMSDTAKTAKRVLMVGHLLQYHPAFVALLRHVRDGGLGTLRYAWSHRLSAGKVRVEENVLWSFAPHDISMLLALFAREPEHVSGSGGCFITPGIEDEYRVDMAFSGGARAHVFASWLHPFKEHKLVVIGTEAMAVFEDSKNGPGKLSWSRYIVTGPPDAPGIERGDPELLPFADEEPLRAECAHFLECCESGETPRTDADEAMRVLRVLRAASPPAKFSSVPGPEALSETGPGQKNY